MKKYVVLDTNIWRYLFNGFDVLSDNFDESHHAILELMERRVDEGCFVFLINELFLEEWKKYMNESNPRIKEIQGGLKRNLKDLKKIKEFVSGENVELEVLRRKIVEQFKKKVEKQKQHIERYENFVINKTFCIGVNNKVKSKAFDLAIIGEKSFDWNIENKRSDAILLLSSLNYIYNELHLKEPRLNPENGFLTSLPDSYFISSNKRDLTPSGSSMSKHPDLERILMRTDTVLYYNIKEFVRLMDRELAGINEKLLDEIDAVNNCGICKSSDPPTLNYSSYFFIYDPIKGSKIKEIDADDISHMDEIELALLPTKRCYTTQIRTAHCSNCDSDFIECDCGKLSLIKDHNKVFDCTGGCGRKFKVFLNKDSNGTIKRIDCELVETHICKNHDGEVEFVDEEGLCGDCTEVGY